MSPDEMKSLTETVLMLKQVAESKPNEWLPVIAALGGALVGALASYIPALLLEHRKARKYSRQVEKSLLVEIASLLEIIELRAYLKGMEDAVEYLGKQPNGTLYTYTIDVPSHYSRIYQENCSNIGVVDEEVAQNIVTFHQLIDAVVQDVKLGGHARAGASIEMYKEMIKIFSRAISIGKELVEDRRNQ